MKCGFCSKEGINMKQIATILMENDADFYEICSKISVDKLNNISRVALEESLRVLMNLVEDNSVRYSVLSVKTEPSNVIN